MNSSTGRLGRLALIACLIAASACSTSGGPRQADRAPSDDLTIPQVEEPGTAHVVQRGVVTEQFQVPGSVLARDTTPVSVPFAAVILERPPRVGTEVEAGGPLFVYGPSSTTRALAAEFEAASYALTYGQGDLADRQERYDRALGAAASAGIPVDDPAALPLPMEIVATSPLTGIVLATSSTGNNEVFGGFVVAEVGRGEDLFVSGRASESVIEFLGIGTTVDLLGEDDEIEGTIVRIDLVEDGAQLTTVSARSGLEIGDEVLVDRGDDLPADAGTVSDAEGDDDSGWTIEVLVPEPRFGLNPVVEVAPRGDLDTIVEGVLETVAITSSIETTMTISVPEGSFPFDESVRVTLYGDTKDDVVWLPPEAIRTFDGVDYVVVEDGEGRRRVDIEIGLRSEDRVEVMGDLDAGDAVIVP